MRRLLWLAVTALVSLPSFSQVSFTPIKLGQNNATVVGDFNGDGREDMLEVIPNNFNTFHLLFSTATGAYTAGPTYAVPGGGRSAGYAVGDFNNDGKLDVAMLTLAPSAIYFFRGNGDGTLQAPVKSSATFSSPNGVVSADVNHDGKMDLVVSTATDQQTIIETYFGNGNGTFTLGPSTQEPFFTFTLRTGDFDGDGNVDLLTTDCGTDGCLMVVY